MDPCVAQLLVERNNMDDDFYDWLDKCPVQWFRGKDDTETVGYTFHKPVKRWKEEDEEE